MASNGDDDQDSEMNEFCKLFKALIDRQKEKCVEKIIEDETSDSPETGKKIIQVVQRLPKLRKEYQDRESAFFAQREISKSRLKEIIDDLDYHKTYSLGKSCF